MQALKKTALGQVTIFPTYIIAFFSYVSLLEGKTMKQAVQKVRDKFWPAIATGTVFWPAANMLNFTMVPPQQRVLYVGLMGLVWNSYLSWQNSSADSIRMHKL